MDYSVVFWPCSGRLSFLGAGACLVVKEEPPDKKMVLTKHSKRFSLFPTITLKLEAKSVYRKEPSLRVTYVINIQKLCRDNESQ